MFGESCRSHWMSVVLHLYVCLFVSERSESKLYLYKTPVYFKYVAYFSYIMWYYVIWDILCLSFNLVTIFKLLTKNHQNQFFIYFYGLKFLVLYNLVLCYSLDPVLVIWHVTLIIFLQIQVYFSKLTKVSFGKSKLGHGELGKTAVPVIFMLIYVIVCCPHVQGAIICDYNENCIFLNVIVFYFVFSAVFIGEGQNLTNYFTFWLYVC